MKTYMVMALALLATLPGFSIAAPTAAETANGPIIPPKPARLPDGRPNWTGFWVPLHGMLEVNIGLGGSAGGKPPLRLDPPFTKFSEVKSPYKEQMAKVAEMAASGKMRDVIALCYPPGMPRMMGMIYGMELLQTRDQIAITSEWQAASRRIWTNRSTHPPADELDPTYTGDSIGHWEGDSLVVDTVGIRDDVPLNYEGLPHSPNLRIHEVFTQKTPGILIDEITIYDSEAFVTPWKEIETYRYRPDLSIREYVCLENNKNVGEDGSQKFSQ